MALQPRSNHVKLHITLMNSGFHEYQCSVNGNSGSQSHLTFDARKILEVSWKNKCIKMSINNLFELEKLLF